MALSHEIGKAKSKNATRRVILITPDEEKAGNSNADLQSITPYDDSPVAKGKKACNKKETGLGRDVSFDYKRFTRYPGQSP